jgi:hypothetical protein
VRRKWLRPYVPRVVSGRRRTELDGTIPHKLGGRISLEVQ